MDIAYHGCHALAYCALACALVVALAVALAWAGVGEEEDGRDE